MAKNNRRRRDTTAIANSVAFSNYAPSRITFPKNLYLQQFEDRRRWHPEGTYAPAQSFSRSRHRLRDVQSSYNRRASQVMARSIPRLHSPVYRVGFEQPHRVLICVRRQQRREVLHAFRKTGRGSGRRPPRYNYYSSISCRR